MSAEFSRWLTRSVGPFKRLRWVDLHVHWTFWPALLMQGDVGFLLLFVFTVSLHEAAHVLAYRAMNPRQPRIVLFGFGGVTVDGLSSMPSSQGRVGVLLAGSIANFSIGLLAINANPFLWHFGMLNVAWGLMNILPMWPLDGGWIMREWLLAKGETEAHATAMILEMARIIGLCMLVGGLLTGNIFLVYLTLVCWVVCHRQYFPSMGIGEITTASWLWLITFGRKLRRRIP